MNMWRCCSEANSYKKIMPTFRESSLPDLPPKDSTNEIQETIALQGVAVEHGKISDAATEWGGICESFPLCILCKLF